MNGIKKVSLFSTQLSNTFNMMNYTIIPDKHTAFSQVWFHDLQKANEKVPEGITIKRTMGYVVIEDPSVANCRQDRVPEVNIRLSQGDVMEWQSST